MKFKRKELDAVIIHDSDILEFVSDNIVGHGRWDISHSLIFKHNGKYYETEYSRGATEYQDNGPEWYDGDEEVECQEISEQDVWFHGVSTENRAKIIEYYSNLIRV